MKESINKCMKPRGAHGATHQEWAYRREAVVWIDDMPIKPNLVPLAKEMTLWLQQKIKTLPLHTKLEQGVPGEASNPYTYSLGALSLSIATIINDAMEFSSSTEPMNPVAVEIQRIRFESELIIYAARFCEAAIKQMLYCTQIPEKLYVSVSMGKLLAQECEGCKKNRRERHDISLLGSLAHRFFLCNMLDGCVIDHLQIVARRRNLEAAHSESQAIHPRTTTESKSHLALSIKEIGDELGHMADHIGTIEEKMIEETGLFIRSFPKASSHIELMKIPVRNLDQYRQGD